jgi:orotate phosphoribosyltransferase
MSLKNLIIAKSFRKGDFVLSSGQPTNYFFDMKPTMLDPAGANLIANGFWEILEGIPYLLGQLGAIGGMATGGIPLVAVLCAKSYFRTPMIPGFYVRKEIKDHGTEQLIDGVLPVGRKVVLLEDVTTTAASILLAVKAVRDGGCFIDDILTVVDREEGAKHNLFSEGLNLHSLYKRSDFD